MINGKKLVVKLGLMIVAAKLITKTVRALTRKHWYKNHRKKERYDMA